MAGPRTKDKDNQFPAIKIALREYVLSLFDNADVLDVYGGHGLMYEKVWKNKAASYSCTEGDAVEWLKQNDFANNVFDVDPYSSPYEAIGLICEKSKNDKIAIVCTDGFLRRQAGMRGVLTKYISAKMGWPKHNNDLLSRIFYNYPGYLRKILGVIAKDHTIEKLVIKYGLGRSHATVYFAVLLKKSE